MTLYFLKYNNYYNRRVKQESSLEGYLQYTVGSPLTGCTNWNPNDGVNTEQVVNSFTWETFESPDYVVVVTEDNEIDSRWFVIENTRLRNGQMKLLLHRDVVVDNYDAILEAPMFIEKATPISVSDPAIYNRENMTFNQIKQSETLLKDETGIPWIVGYVPRDATFPDPIGITVPYATTYDWTGETLSDWEYYEYADSTNRFSGVWSKDMEFCVQVTTDPSGRQNQKSICFNSSGLTDTEINLPDYRPSLSVNAFQLSSTKAAVYEGYTSVMSQMVTQAESLVGKHTAQQVQDFLYWNNKILYDSGADKYYQVKVVTLNFTDAAQTEVVPESTLFQLMKNNLASEVNGTPDGKSFTVLTWAPQYYMQLTELTTDIKVTIGARNQLDDSPYDMFCIPYGALTVYESSVEKLTTSLDTDSAVALAVEIMRKAGSSTVYDLQLLPYCPLREAIKENGTFDIYSRSLDEIVTDNGTVVSYMFWCSKSNFTFNIPVSIPGGNTVQEKKIINETQMWRLCSPNYQGVFEFNAAQNNGVEWVNVDATYKPFAPYIHLNPNFKNLYGADFNDSRGLTCGGDYSLPQVTNAWADYQLNNKNYQQMFDREIQNLEVQRDVQRGQQISSIITGALSSGGSGALLGNLLGGTGSSTFIGGALGAAASLVGGAVDMGLSEKLYNENLDYKRDMFGYQLGNIKALPSSLAKNSALTFNNKLFPFIEWYNCTTQEVQALKDKLKYNGYSIGRIGKMIDYLQSEPSYIKGQIIRIEGVADDFHGLKAISDELYKGVFV